MRSRRIGVLGGGAWGTALAQTMIRAGHSVRLWARDDATVSTINHHNENPRYLPGVVLDRRLQASGDLQECCRGAAAVLLVTPAQTVNELVVMLAPIMESRIPLVLCAKGIDRRSGHLLSDIAAKALPGHPIAALSGPSFAGEVARDKPTAVTIAAGTAELAGELATLLSAPHFRCYSTDDLVGVQAGGALKNVLAIAAGAIDGAELGASAQAAMVTRGFVELRRLAIGLGARAETVMGLSGLGDLILTCGSARSRNFSYGRAIGRADSLAGLALAEGVATAFIAARLARERHVEAPIIDTVAQLLDRQLSIEEAVSALLSRPLKHETT